MTYVSPKKRPSQRTAFKIEDIKIEAEKDGAENDHQIALWAIDHSTYWRAEGFAAIINKLEDMNDETKH